VVDRVARERLFASIREKVGHLDVVFANAGIAKQGSIADTEELFDEVFKVNVTAVFLTVQAALPLMRDGGSIILNSSIAATAGVAGSGAYAGSKAAVKAMAHPFASELAPRGIRVNSVVPGIIRTPIWGRNSTQSQEKSPKTVAVCMITVVQRAVSARDRAVCSEVRRRSNGGKRWK
jgi:NAD(P)-dependent dehydrogenase (short-subunit alcohol dehydrogenase family)